MFKRKLVIAFLVCFMLVLNLASIASANEKTNTTLPFILRNTNFAFHERTDAVIIDAGQVVDGSSLSESDFDVHVLATRIVDPSFVWYDGPREVIDVYTSNVNDCGYPSDTGQYIVLDFPDVGWGDGGYTNDGGYTFNFEYTITYKGTQIDFVDGSSIVPEAFVQTGVVSPVLDQFKYASYNGQDYSYFYNETATEPLPLVVFFHGGGQGNDIYTPIRFSNGGTVWANPENQAKYPCHVLAPRNATTAAAMQNVKAIIDQMIEDGKVDPNRVYITGFSMGGGSTWTFLQNYPDFPAAAPLCPAGGPGSVEKAQAVAYLPLWTFVDEKDFLYNMVVNNDKTYGPYWYDSILSILPENRLDNPPYNGWVFDGHSVWLPAYNEYVHPERGMLIDWLFSKSKIRNIAEVEVTTVSGVAPTLPDKVVVDVNHSASGIISEERSVTWNGIDPQSYEGPGVFKVEGTVEGCVEKAIATVTVTATDVSALVLTSDKAGVITKGEYFNIVASLKNAEQSNTSSITFTYDPTKYLYRGFTEAEGLTKFNVKQEEGIVTIILGNLSDYNLLSIGTVLFSAREDVDLENEESTITARLDYVTYDDNQKVIKTLTGSLSFSTVGVPGDTDGDRKITLLDLSNLIDYFGVTSADQLWATAKFFDFNRNGQIDINDISFVAARIE